MPSVEEQVAERAAAPSAELPHIPGYDVLEELGRGGMGVVYKARQIGLNRLVAIKMILAGSLAGYSQVRRFHAEAEAVAQMQHPNIVQVYETGEWRPDGVGAPVPYFSLEFVEGGSLDKHLGGNPLRPREAAQLVETLARAMHAAHERGIVHRDLKPGNILLAVASTQRSTIRTMADASVSLTMDHVPLTTVPKISDFGLAKQVHTDSGTTRTGEIVGTPSYMAPEQAVGNTKAVGPAVDVYALGAILYETLTGRPPFKAPTAVATITQLLSEDPVPVTQLQVGTPRDLDTICLKCLAKEPARRYATAQELADDLSRFQRGDPIRARPPTIGYLARKFIQKHRTRLAVAAGVLLLMLLGTVLAFLRIDAERDRAVDALGREEVAKRDVQSLLDQARKSNQTLAQQQRDLQHLLAESYLQSGISDCVKLEPGLGLSSLLAAHEAAPPDDPLRQSIRLLMTGWELSLFPRLMHDGEIEAVGFHPSDEFVMTASRDGTVQFWDIKTGRPQGRPLQPGGKVWSAVFSPDGRLLATGDDQRGVTIWDVESRRPVGPPLPHTPRVFTLAFNPDGKLLATGCKDGFVRLWDVASLKPQGQPLLHSEDREIFAVAFSPDGKTLVSGGEDRLLRFWDPSSGQPVGEPIPHTGGIWSIAYRPDGQRFFTGDWGPEGVRGVGRIFDSSTHKLISDSIRCGEREGFLAAQYTPDGRQLLTGSSGDAAQLWDADSFSPLREPIRHQRSVRAVAASRDGSTFLTGSRDGRARLIMGLQQRAVGPALPHPAPVLCLAVSADGKRLATGCADGTARLWDLGSSQRIGQDMKHERAVTTVAFAEEGRLLVTGSSDRLLGLWNGQTGEPLGDKMPYQDEITALAVAPDASWLLVGGQDRARVMDRPTAKVRGDSLKHDGAIRAVAVRPGGQQLLSAGGDACVRIWDQQTHHPVGQPLRHKDPVRALATDRQGKLLTTASEDNKGRLWDLDKQQLIHEFKDDLGHGRNVTAIAFHPEGSMVLTGGEDAQTRLWDVLTGNAIGEPIAHDQAVRAVAFLPDGKHYLVARDSGVVDRWATPQPYPDDPKRLAAWIRARTAWSREGHLHRSLSVTEWSQNWQEVEKLGGPLRGRAPSPPSHVDGQ
jgi:WD40 repeat protein/serine/threonine protein kinase